MIDINKIEGIRFESKYVGVVEVSDPTDVTTRLGTMGDDYSNGGIFCSCPELGFEGVNLIYCRYGLSLPWYKVKDGDRLWIEPTIGHNERWIYTGFVDCGRDTVAPGSTDQMILLNESGKYTITLGNLSIVLDSDGKTAIIDANGDAKAKIILDANTSKIDIINDTNKIEMNTSGIKVTDKNNNIIEMTSSGTTITDANNNTITMSSTSVKINDNLEVLP